MNREQLLLIIFASTRRSYRNVLKAFFDEKLLCTQQLLSDGRYVKILKMIPDKFSVSLRKKWQENSFSSGASDINVVQWEQLKHQCESTKQKAPEKSDKKIVYIAVFRRL